MVPSIGSSPLYPSCPLPRETNQPGRTREFAVPVHGSYFPRVVGTSGVTLGLDQVGGGRGLNLEVEESRNLILRGPSWLLSSRTLETDGVGLRGPWMRGRLVLRSRPFSGIFGGDFSVTKGSLYFYLSTFELVEGEQGTRSQRRRASGTSGKVESVGNEH